jgi:hypothetical protein
MSLKRMLNDDDDDVVYTPSSLNLSGGIFSPTGQEYGQYPPSASASVPSSANSSVPRSPPFASPTATRLSPTDGFGFDSGGAASIDEVDDVAPVVEELPSGSMNDLLNAILNGPFTNDASVNNIEATETSIFDFGESIEQWAVENMASLSHSHSTGGSPPSQATPTPTPTTPSLMQGSNASTAATTEDEEVAEVVCYGMVCCTSHTSLNLKLGIANHGRPIPLDLSR